MHNAPLPTCVGDTGTSRRGIESQARAVRRMYFHLLLWAYLGKPARKRISGGCRRGATVLLTFGAVESCDRPSPSQRRNTKILHTGFAPPPAVARIKAAATSLDYTSTLARSSTYVGVISTIV